MKLNKEREILVVEYLKKKKKGKRQLNEDGKFLNI